MTTTMAPASSGHIRKRPFQPSINSYFAARDNAPSSSAPPERRARSPMSPPLPDETQASLLSVGMRVRKSVPEGYKTHKTLGVEGIALPSTTPVRLAEGQRADSGVSSGKELTPFCGLHKTGGWGPQEVPSSSAPAAFAAFAVGEEEEDEEMPGLMTSQYTLSSTQGSFGANEEAGRVNGRKRTYEEEVEEDLNAFFDDFGGDESGIVRGDRPFARMKGRGRKSGGEAKVQVPSGSDFEEAIFLTPQERMDIDAA